MPALAAVSEETDPLRGDRNHWLGVELRHLAALAAVAHEGSFRAAADSLGYVQSAVSQQIAYLERLVGARLVDRSRGPRPVKLTDSGRMMLSHADAILAQLQAARADLNALAEGEGGLLRVGVHESVSTGVMPGLIAAMRLRHPGIDVATRESSTDAELFELVAAGDLDVAFADLPLAAGPFEYRELLSDPFVLVVQAGSPLARRGPIRSLEELGDVQLIGGNSCRHTARIQRHLSARPLESDVVLRSDITATVQAFVGAGIGVAVLPRLAVDEHDPATAVVSLDALVPPRTIALFWHRERSHALLLDRFVDVARKVCGDLAESRHLADKAA